MEQQFQNWRKAHSCSFAQALALEGERAGFETDALENRKLKYNALRALGILFKESDEVHNVD